MPTMNTQKIDVLAVMDTQAIVVDAYLHNDYWKEMRLARAAVAELIEAAERYMEVRGTTHGQTARNRLRAALARIGGAP
jgi:hypothetical protein